ncbi:hypothetical protein EVAR_7775_1 [Eumeta japonica]|uniref:Uncharacterized protein n=1 Tax=Eumeta variegata TaxID=151549 RepID=A0A4C1TJX9_EUMVA|nr:hypothetical protein EVAR_7775_1 [Eumeta japonica]
MEETAYGHYKKLARVDCGDIYRPTCFNNKGIKIGWMVSSHVLDSIPRLGGCHAAPARCGKWNRPTRVRHAHQIADIKANENK